MATNVCGQSQQSNELFDKGIAAYEKHKYADAVKYFLAVDSLDEIEMAQDDSHKGYGSGWAAYCYYLMGDTVKAQQLNPYNYKLKPINRRVTVISDSLNTLGMRAYGEGNYVEALRLISDCGDEEAKILGKDHYFRANTLQMLGYVYADMKQYENVIKYMEEANHIYEKNDSWTGIIYNAGRLADAYWNIGKEEVSNKCMQGAIKKCVLVDTTLYNAFNADLAFTLADLCCNYSDWTDAFNMSYTAIHILEKLKQVNSESYYATLQIVTLASYMYDLTIVHDYAHRLCEMEKKYPGTETSIYNIMAHAHLLKCQKDSVPESVRFAKADELIYQIRKQFDEKNDFYIEGLFLKAELCDEANVEEIKKFGRLFRKMLDKGCNASFYNINKMKKHIAISLKMEGKNKEAEDLLKESVDSLLNYALTDQRCLFLLKENLSMMSSFMTNNAEQLVAYLERAKSIIEKTRFVNQNIYSNILSQLMISYGNLGNYEMRYKYSKQIIDIYNYNKCNEDDYKNALAYQDFDKVTLGKYQTNKALPDINDNSKRWTYNDITTLLQMFIRYFYEGNREDFFKTTSKFKELALGFGKDSYPYVGSSILCIMAELCWQLSEQEYEEKLKELKSLEKGVKKFIDTSSDSYRQYIMQLMKCYLFLDKRNELKNLAVKYTGLVTDYIKGHFQTMSYEERSQFWFANNAWFLRDLPMLLQRYPCEELNSCAYDAQLLSKGLLLNSERALSDNLAKIGNDSITTEFHNVQELRKELNGMYKSITTNEATIDSLRNAIRTKERNLMAKVSNYGDYTDELISSWKEVAKILKNGECALEFVTVPKDSDMVYGVLMIRPWSQYPKWIELCKQTELNNITNADYYATTKLSQLLWHKIETYLWGTKTVYFSASGSLHSIALEYLPLADGQRIGEKYAMRRLSSTREILRKDNQQSSWKSIVLYGGLDYWADGNSHEASMTQKRGVAGSDGTLSPLEKLEYTATEVDGINKLMQSKGFTPKLYTENIGTEESFKALSEKGVDLIHIATHGYFAPFNPYSAAKEMEKMGLDLVRNASTQEDVQLSSAQLMMAGANNAIVGDIEPEQENDGILTAQELSKLDLHSVDLAVLSACQTALGMVNGEGVFGLQRGFKKAGVKTIMMSLWEVDDRATQLLMIHFYENLLNGKSKQNALQEAQQYLRTVDNGTFDNPEYWAAFILLDAIN